jgi:hypothetical protein
MFDELNTVRYHIGSSDLIFNQQIVEVGMYYDGEIY